MTARSKKVHKIGPNQLLWDLGVDSVDSEVDVRRKIVEMEKRFHLVMILEHFEVSISTGSLKIMVGQKLHLRAIKRHQIKF